MISIGQDLKDELQNYEITPVTLITLDFPDTDAVPAGGTMNFTDAPRDLVIGGTTYFSSDQVKNISTPQTQNSVDRDNYSITFTDGDAAIRSRFDKTHTGVPINVRVAFRKADGTLTTEILNVYRGQSSTVRWYLADGDALCDVGFTGQLAQLEATKVISTTDASQFNVDDTDTSMAFTHNSIEDVNMKWGKK